ncbi:hypothetical protein [Leeia oryzae]|uniref:hypothetical protein n=1 Tax=Leeia oryzae TaxID=356662 RepID=UPI0003A8656F|nr:hypothetical protein [Leeia oryzae]
MPQRRHTNPFGRVFWCGVRLGVTGLLVVSASAMAQGFTAARLSGQDQTLTLYTSVGKRIAAPVQDGQTGFSQPRLSPGGYYAGWLVMEPNCCTSYPIALRLVVVNGRQAHHTFSGNGLPIYGWCFADRGTAVVYRQGVLHGSNVLFYQKNRIRDGKLLASFEYDEDEHNVPVAPVPAWARCARP